MKEQINTLVTLVKTHKMFIFVIILVPFVTFLFALFYKPIWQAPRQSSNTNTAISKPTPVKDGIEQEEKQLGWTPTLFTADDIKGTDAVKTTLPDGSIQYAIPSDNPNRPQIIIVKHGLLVLQRTPINDTTVTAFTAHYGDPEYTAKGSYFWGQNIVTYIYLSIGFAFVVNTNNSMVLEQMYFQPVSEALFKKTYGGDLIGNLQKIKKITN